MDRSLLPKLAATCDTPEGSASPAPVCRESRRFLVGANPTRRSVARPEAIGATQEVTNVWKYARVTGCSRQPSNQAGRNASER